MDYNVIHINQHTHYFYSLQTLAEDCAPFCRQCQQRRPSVKRQAICRVPSLLLIHLKRFSSSGFKIFRHVHIAEFLELAGAYFRLHGVIVHHGNETVGHYITLMQQSLQHWAMFDDDRIIDQLQVEDAHRDELSRFSYVCLYQQVPAPHYHFTLGEGLVQEK